MTQMSAFQVEPISFQVAEHLFDPHAAAVRSQCISPRKQAGGQEPGFIFAHFPVEQQVDRVSILGGQ
jgi:hypothetical protein